MTMEYALKAVKLGGCGFNGSRMLADRVGAAQGFYAGRERVPVCGGGVTYGTSLRLAHVACSESAQSPAPAKRKKKVEIRKDGPTKPELKLVRDLQEFISSCDLPLDELPTTAELAKLGRPDLANRVRRKGYKQVAELLEKVRIADTDEATENKGVTVPPNGSVVNNSTRNDDVELSSVKADETATIDAEEPSDPGSRTDRVLEGLPPSAGPGTKPASVNGHASLREELDGDTSRNNVADISKIGIDHVVLGEATRSTSYTDLFQDNQDNGGDVIGSIQPVGLSQDFSNEKGGDSSTEEEYEIDDTNDEEDDDEFYEEDDDDGSPRHIPVRPDPDIAYQKAALLKAKLLQYLDNRKDDFRTAKSLANPKATKETVEVQGEQVQTYLGDVQIIQTFDTPKELNHLKSLLELREVELTEVSKQLEEARAMLSLARAKATGELVHVKQQTVEQDLRLEAAEKALSHLKKVHLEWWGEASRVEVAGSFNGWQHNILLEPDFSSEIPKPDGTRGPMMWGTYLCLYPGVYEIKFVVDGNWQVDHRREVVMRHSNQNNILRVE